MEDNIKIVLKAFASYNKSVNDKMTMILKNLTEDQIRMDLKGYYHSILGTFVHLLKGDLTWIERFMKSFPGFTCFSGGNIPLYLKKEISDFEKNDYTKLFEVRKNLDLLIESFVEECRKHDLDSIISYLSAGGDKIEEVLWQCLFHIFNHQTHHRGQIAVLLDILGIQNDFSGMLAYLN